MSNISVQTTEVDGHVLSQWWDADIKNYIWIDETYQTGAFADPHFLHELPVITLHTPVERLIELRKQITDQDVKRRFKTQTFFLVYRAPSGMKDIQQVVPDMDNAIVTTPMSYTYDLAELEERILARFLEMGEHYAD